MTVYLRSVFVQVEMRQKSGEHQGEIDALAIDRQACRDFALQFSWSACTDQFARNLVPLRA